MKEFWSQVSTGRINKWNLQVFLRVQSSSHRKTIASEILGKNIIFPEQITDATEMLYTQEQLDVLDSTIPPVPILVWAKENNYIVFPGPPKPMGLLDIKIFRPSLFETGGGVLFHEEIDAEVNKTKVLSQWYAVRSEPLPYSTNKSWVEQLALLRSVEFVPNAATMVWLLTSFSLVRGVRLLNGIFVRCSDILPDGERIHLGRFALEGLCIRHRVDEHHDPTIGVASSRSV